MDRDMLWQQFAALPSDARAEVADFIAFLRAKHAARRSTAASPPPLANEPFVGIWRDRDELNDASEWVRLLRRREWHDQ